MLFGPQVQLNQRVWPVIFDITGPICARTFKLLDLQTVDLDAGITIRQ
jgi:hypothetical protein